MVAEEELGTLSEERPVYRVQPRHSTAPRGQRIVGLACRGWYSSCARTHTRSQCRCLAGPHLKSCHLTCLNLFAQGLYYKKDPDSASTGETGCAALAATHTSRLECLLSSTSHDLGGEGPLLGPFPRDSPRAQKSASISSRIDSSAVFYRIPDSLHVLIRVEKVLVHHFLCRSCISRWRRCEIQSAIRDARGFFLKKSCFSCIGLFFGLVAV